MSKAIFLSVRPNFAELILSGTKTVEVRRVVPRGAQPGSLVLIYASSPEKALLGICFIERVSTGRPETIWRKSGGLTGLRKKDFLSYLGGADKAVALHISKPVVFSRPIPLSEIRQAWQAFQPPQSFSYISLSKVEELAKGSRRRRLALPGAGAIG